MAFRYSATAPGSVRKAPSSTPCRESSMGSASTNNACPPPGLARPIGLPSDERPAGEVNVGPVHIPLAARPIIAATGFAEQYDGRPHWNWVHHLQGPTRDPSGRSISTHRSNGYGEGRGGDGAPQSSIPKASPARSTMYSPMAREEVAPGDGAFKTCTASRPRMMLKSSRRVPSRATA